MNNLEKIYTNLIMENSISTKNKYELVDIDKKAQGHNPSCGDNITIEIKYDKNIIKELSFIGYGCAISQASASMMIDLLKGKSKEDAIRLIDIFLKMVEGKHLDEKQLELLGDAIAFKSIIEIPTRVKCASLAWQTMKKTLEQT